MVSAVVMVVITEAVLYSYHEEPAETVVSDAETKLASRGWKRWESATTGDSFFLSIMAGKEISDKTQVHYYYYYYYSYYYDYYREYDWNFVDTHPRPPPSTPTSDPHPRTPPPNPTHDLHSREVHPARLL